MMKKGQFIRLFLKDASMTSSSTKVIGAAKELTLHISSSVEDSSTKDTSGTWVEQEVTGLSYDISTSSLLLDDYSDDTDANNIESFETYMYGNKKLAWEIANTSSTKNRVKGTVICSGTAILTQMQISAQNKQNVSCSVNLNGYGELLTT